MYNRSLCDKIYRVELFDKGYHWITQNPYGEDTELNWFLFHRAECVHFLPVYGYHYMSRESSMMRSKFSWDFMAYLDRMDFILSNIGKSERCLKKSVLRVFFDVGISHMFRALLLRGDDSYQKMKFGIYRNMLLKHAGEPALELSEDAYEALHVIAEEHDSPAEHYDSIEKQFAERIRAFCRDYQVVYVYGAGIYAKKLARFMEKHDIRFQGFAVTEKGNSDEYVGYPVMSLEHMIEKHGSACGFVLGLSEKNMKGVVSILKQKNMNHFLKSNIYVLRCLG